MRGVYRRIARRDRLCVYLGSGWTSLCAVSGRLRPTIGVKAILPSLPSSPLSLDSSLAALETWMHTHQNRATIDWLVGIEYARYLLLPWDEHLHDDAFCRTLAAALFAQQCADTAPDFSAYQMRLGPLAYGHPRLAALVPIQVIDSLTAFAHRHQCHTRRITPMLGVVWNRFFANDKTGSGTLALLEGQRLIRLGYEKGRFKSLAVQPFFRDRTPVIAEGKISFFPAQDIQNPESGSLTLQGMLPADDVRLAYALCGAV